MAKGTQTGRKQAEDLLWYFKNLNAEGRENLLKIARSFVATGEFARTDELSDELREHLKKCGAILDEMHEYGNEIPE